MAGAPPFRPCRAMIWSTVSVMPVEPSHLAPVGLVVAEKPLSASPGSKRRLAKTITNGRQHRIIGGTTYMGASQRRCKKFRGGTKHKPRWLAPAAQTCSSSAMARVGCPIERTIAELASGASVATGIWPADRLKSSGSIGTTAKWPASNTFAPSRFISSPQPARHWRCLR